MEDILIPIFGMVTTFGSIFGILYIFFMTRNRERLALIEKADQGFDANIFNKRSKKENLLKYGIWLIGAAVGVFFGYILSLNGVNETVSFILMILLFLGIAFVVSFFLVRKMFPNEEE